jgi:pyruvate/2-oxoglutarate dehydrogenase complex dihydrolipoamide dehydrogenase (E3) component
MTTEPEAFDAIIIGAGQSGPFLAVRLAKAGWNVALVEREHLGGTCVNDGCIPTKTLVASARAAHVARRAADYGVVLPGPVHVDMKAVKARKDAIVGQSIANLTNWIAGTDGLTLIWGHARFAARDTVEVGGRRLTAPKIFINTGGRPMVPDWPGLEGVPYLTNTSMMALDTLPRHLIVAGGSYIGLEFAQIMRRFGAEVTVLEYADRLIAREDPEISEAVRAILEGEGITIHSGVRDFAIAGSGTDLTFTGTAAGSPLTIDASHLLFAVGRKANTDDLGLEQAGVATDPRGFITVDDRLATNVPGVFALGDVNGRGAFTHTSYNDYEIMAANLLDGEDRKVTDRLAAYALFTDPPLGRCGMSEAEARASGRKVLKAVLPMTRVGRARERGETQGFMKVLVDAETRLILGAALLCIEGDEIIHTVLQAMAAGTPYATLMRTVPIHPTVSEMIPTLLSELAPLD